jgi:putative ABC transport system permease protein
MGLGGLVRAELWRKPERTIFTVASLAVGFLLFGVLQGVNTAFSAAVSRTEADRLLIDSRFDAPLPLAYAERIEKVPGVTQVTWTHFLFGYYQDPGNTVIILTTSPERFFQVRNEAKASAAVIERLAHTRTGLVVMTSLAQKYGWKVGDHVSVISAVPRKDGGNTWTFDIVGLFTVPSNAGQVPYAIANYEYFDEARADDRGTVGRFVIRIADPRRASAVARSIDTVFANSSVPTLTQVESEFAARSLATIGDVGTLTQAVIIAVCFAMLFLTASVVLQSVRERTPELAVLKTLGYSDRRVLLLVELEALALCRCGAVIGLGLAFTAFHFIGKPMGEINLYLRTANLSVAVIVEGVVLALALTLAAAAIPAWSAMRLGIADAMRVRV